MVSKGGCSSLTSAPCHVRRKPDIGMPSLLCLSPFLLAEAPAAAPVPPPLGGRAVHLVKRLYRRQLACHSTAVGARFVASTGPVLISCWLGEVESTMQIYGSAGLRRHGVEALEGEWW